MSSRASRRDGLPTLSVAATNVYVSAVALVALGLLWLGYSYAGAPYDGGALAVLTVLAIAGWLLRESGAGQRLVRLSFISIVLLASAVIIGPFGSGVVGAVANLAEWRRGHPTVCLFNAAMNSAIGSVGGLVYLLLGGSTTMGAGSGAATILLEVGLPLLIADVAQCVVNALLLAGVMRSSARVPLLTQVATLLTTSGVAYVGYGIIGFLFVVLWIPAKVGWFSAVLVLAPLFVARWAFVQYGDELRAQERTLRALVTAVETKDPSSREHSDRTAQLAEWLAETLGLGHKEIQEVRTAAMLHDVGKVGVPTKILRARRALTDSELVSLAEHAGIGVELVRGIDFLTGSVEGIAHHHERFDGRGYPQGLEAAEIPLAARILAVADTFDALTTQRPYRPALSVEDAVEVIRARAGSQFDPEVVDVLGRVMERHPWTLLEDELIASTGPDVLEHDEPEMSDLYADRSDLRAAIRGAAIPMTPAASGRA